MAKKRRINKQRLQQLIIAYTIVTLIAAAVIAVFLINTNSDKGKYRNLGIEAFQKGQFDEAAVNFERSLEEKQWFTGNTDTDTRMYLGACYLRQGRYSDAEVVYGQVEKDPGDVDRDLLRGLKETAAAMNELEVMRMQQSGEINTETLEKAAVTQPYMYLSLASIYIDRGDELHARTALNSYLSQRPLNTYVAYELSTAYLNEKKYSEAKDMIEKGLASGDSSFTDLLRFNEIVLMEVDGQYEEALNAVEALLKQYPENAAMKKEYDFLYTRVNLHTTPVNPESDALLHDSPSQDYTPEPEPEETQDQGSDETQEEYQDQGSDETQEEYQDE